METQKKQIDLEAMVDIESLDTVELAVVFQISMVIFSPTEEVPDLYMNFYLDIDEQLDNGRTTSKSTLEFWNSPENKPMLDKAISIINESEVRSNHSMHATAFTIAENINTINRIYGYSNVNFNIVAWWSRGNFDFPILNNLFRQVNMPVPWSKHCTIKELRTLAYELGVPKVESEVPHNGIHDCKAQIKTLKQCRAKIARWKAMETSVLGKEVDK